MKKVEGVPYRGRAQADALTHQGITQYEESHEQDMGIIELFGGVSQRDSRHPTFWPDIEAALFKKALPLKEAGAFFLRASVGATYRSGKH